MKCYYFCPKLQCCCKVCRVFCRRNVDVDACMRGLRVALEYTACIVVGLLCTTVNTISNNSIFVIWFYCVHV
jgi:hypothetical protein